jgi:SAM-dependent methyltransferase
VSAPEDATDVHPPDGPPARFDAGSLYGHWYYDTYTVPYDDNDHWQRFFGQVADAIVTQLAPKTVLDAGCAKGFLVAALRERGVEAYGFDLSEIAIAHAPEAARPYVRVGSLTEPIDGQYDLVTCIEVIEHLDPADADRAVSTLARASNRVLLSSTPGDRDEATHVNVQPPERWAQLFAANGLFRDVRHDASYLSPWAVLFTRAVDRTVSEVVFDYERAWAQLRAETIEQRAGMLELQEHLEGRRDRHHDDPEALRKEILRLRDLVVGMEGQLGVARGQVAELKANLERYVGIEHRLNDVLESRSWRIMWLVGSPLRRLRAQRTA